jgi:hypothetical protein
LCGCSGVPLNTSYGDYATLEATGAEPYLRNAAHKKVRVVLRHI